MASSQVKRHATESLRVTIQRLSETYGDESDDKKDMMDSNQNQPENINIEHGETNEGPMQRRHSSTGTEKGLRSRKSRWLLLVVALFLRAYKASLSASFGVYYVQFLLYFNVTSGTASWMRTLEQVFSLTVGKDHYCI